MMQDPRWVLEEIERDCERDARKWEGAEMTGHNVATMHGETLAMVSALAHIMATLLPDEKETR